MTRLTPHLLSFTFRITRPKGLNSNFFHKIIDQFCMVAQSTQTTYMQGCVQSLWGAFQHTTSGARSEIDFMLIVPGPASFFPPASLYLLFDIFSFYSENNTEYLPYASFPPFLQIRCSNILVHLILFIFVLKYIFVFYQHVHRSRSNSFPSLSICPLSPCSPPLSLSFFLSLLLSHLSFFLTQILN